jgi:hypothetical protein
MYGTTMCRFAYRTHDALHPISILSHVHKRLGRQAGFSTYRGQLDVHVGKDEMLTL